MIVPGSNSAFQVSQLSGNTLSIIGADVALSQAEVPYTLAPSGLLPPSSTDLVVYGDTVTITGDLLNPGRQIAIYARQIVIGAAAFLNVSGGDPQTSYLPGDPAPQITIAQGAAGAGGAAGSTGTTGGTIILAAESIVVQGGDSGAGSQVRVICLRQALAQAVSEAIAGSDTIAGIFPLVLSTINLPFTNISPLQLNGNIEVSGLTISDASAVQSVTVEIASDTSSGTITIDLGTVAVNSATATFTISPPNSSSSAPLNASAPLSATCDLVLNLTFSLSQPTQLTLTQQTATLNNFAFNLQAHAGLLDDAMIDALDLSVLTPNFPAAFAQQVQSLLAANMANLITAISHKYLSANTSSNAALALLALGGAGGRGQDGHAGIQGGGGTAGQKTGDSAGPGQPPPAQAVGGPGDPGGQGGNAGTSGTGGQGGTITINLINPSSQPLNTSAMAVSVDGGVGGVAAAAGAPGPGGPGGAGGTYETGFPYNWRTATAPNGPTGASGQPANFQGAIGAMGSGGAATLNGNAVTSGGSMAAFAYDQFAPLLPLYQLLFTQQAAKLAYLNAQQVADYQNVIALFTWLQNVTRIFSASPAPSFSNVTASDVATRAAIYQAATLELARLTLKLDYYGNPANWVPVLTWSALDVRATQLVNLGSIINTQLQTANTPSSQQAAAQAAQGKNLG